MSNIKINLNTQKGKEKLSKIINDGVNEILCGDHEMYEYPYKVKKSAYDDYSRMLTLVESLKQQGKCDYEFDDIDKPYTIHCIVIIWKVNNDIVEFQDTREISELLSLSDGFIIDTFDIDKGNGENNANEWQLSTQIYFED